MSEEKEKEYRIKLDGTVYFVGGSYEHFNDVDVIRQTENSVILLKDKLAGFDFFKTSMQYPLRNLRCIKTEIVECEEIE